MKKQIVPPKINDLFNQSTLDIFAKFNCHRIGIIQSFSSATMTAKVQMVDKNIILNYNGEKLLDLPPLVDCPVFMPINNSKGFTYPVSIGDECLILFNDRDIDKWFSNGQVQQQNSNRMHDFSDALVIVGFHSKLKPVTNFNENATEIKYEDSIISVSDKIKIENAEKNLRAVIDKLIDTVKLLKVQNGAAEYPITAATSTALDEVSTDLNLLLE